MSRIIFSSKRNPLKVEPNTSSIWICQCGLSKNKPYCDGSHTLTNAEIPGETYLYTNITQKRLNLSGYKLNAIERLKNQQPQSIYEDEKIRIERIKCNTARYFEAVEIRKSSNAACPIDIYDNWSDIYLLYKNNAPCATMRVAQARDGALDVEDFYPTHMLKSELRSHIGSANSLYKLKNSNCTHEDVFLFIKQVWVDQYIDGMRIDLINATIPMALYYRNLGYKQIGSRFVHPSTKKESIALYYIANINNDCKLTNTLKDFYTKHDSSMEEFNYLNSFLKTNH